MNRLYKELPEIIQAILLTSEGWLVGSSINQILNKEVVKDYDIIVPSRELFMIVCKFVSSITDKVKINSFGGIKIQILDTEIDIWCEEFDHFLKTANKLDYFFNMKRNILLQKL